MKVQYTGAIFDSSGYAEAGRNYIEALLTQPEIDLSIKPVSFETWKTDTGAFGHKVKSLIGKHIKPDVQILHLTPENYIQHKIPGIKNIGYTAWETSRLPTNWVTLCNTLDEIWVPCDWNVEVFKSSGVVVPVRKVPHTIDLQVFSTYKKTKLDHIPIDTFNFYSVFQWSSRKNPEGLLAAYLAEFRPADKVSLVLKTYIHNNTSSDKNATVQAINKIKQDLQLNAVATAPITLIHGGLSRDEMLSLHDSCSCFVLPHRSEGWGVPHFEAMAMNRPVITTGFGGNLEFMNGSTSYLTSFNMTPVSGMGRPTYNGWMDWAEPNIGSLRYQMRYVYEHQEEAKQKALLGREFIGKFDHKVVGKQMKELLCG